jgi:hypothetical protein
MFITIKILLYLVAAHVFYNNGFDPERHIFNFAVLMSVYILIDMISHFGARSGLIREIVESEGEM